MLDNFFMRKKGKPLSPKSQYLLLGQQLYHDFLPGGGLKPVSISNAVAAIKGESKLDKTRAQRLITTHYAGFLTYEKDWVSLAENTTLVDFGVRLKEIQDEANASKEGGSKNKEG